MFSTKRVRYPFKYPSDCVSHVFFNKYVCTVYTENTVYATNVYLFSLISRENTGPQYWKKNHLRKGNIKQTILVKKNKNKNGVFGGAKLEFCESKTALTAQYLPRVLVDELSYVGL